MKEKEIKTSQIAMLFITIVPITKMMLLPTLLAAVAGVDLWIAAAIFFAADLLALACILKAYKLCPDMDIYDILSASLGKIGAKILLTLYAAYFILKAVTPMMEQKQLFVSTLYEAMPRFAATIPFLVTCGYVCYKGLTALARNASVAVWFTAASMAILLGLALPSVKADNFLPVLADGFAPVGRGLWTTPMWFGDFVIVLAFLGKIKSKNGRVRGVIAGGIVSAAASLLLLAVTVGIFGTLTVRQLSAITKIAKFNITFSNIGRFDWLPIIVLMLAVLVASSAMLYGAVTMLRHVFAVKNSMWIILPLIFLLLLAVFLLRDDFIRIYDALRYVFNYPALALQYVVPALLPLLAKRAAAKQPLFQVNYETQK